MYGECIKEEIGIGCEPDSKSDFCRTCDKYYRIIKEEAENEMEREDYEYEHYYR